MTHPAAIGDADWKGFEKRLRRYVRGRVDPASADDVVGAILLSLVEHRGALAEAGNPIAYVQRVATNAVTDHYRRRAAERRALEQVEGLGPDAPDPDAREREQVEGAMGQCFEAFIEDLPARYRDALRLVELDGLTQAEAARRLGLSHSGLKSRVQRGRAHLRTSVLKCCRVDFDRRGGLTGFALRSVRCVNRSGSLR